MSPGTSRRRISIALLATVACGGSASPSSSAPAPAPSTSTAVADTNASAAAPTPSASTAPIAAAATASTTLAAPSVSVAGSPAAVCTRRFASDAELRAAPEGGTVTLADLVAKRPASGRFTVEGFVESPHHCGACPPGAACKPCEDDVWLVPTANASKRPLSPERDLRVYVPDASKLQASGRYRLTIEPCAGSSPTYELRGYKKL